MARALALLLLLSLAIVLLESINGQVQAEVTGIFVFGDSTADVGTNSFLPSSNARANFPHNGVDFPFHRATGRFSNGLNSADFLAKLFGFKRSPPPFLASVNNTSVLKRKKFRGLNFASGGSGLLDITGKTKGTLMMFGKETTPSDFDASVIEKQNVIPLSEQIAQFTAVHRILLDTKGLEATKEFLSKSLFFISTGSNDVFGYFYSKRTIPHQQFLGSLGLAYEKFLMELIDLGATKFGIISLAPIGCCPSQRVRNETGGCLEELNDYARAFHSTLERVLCKLSSQFKHIKYSLGNAFEMTINVIDNPLPFNFTEVQTACCGTGRLNAEGFCNPTAKLCPNRNNYLFWDLFHPTQAASKLAAFTLYGGGQRFVAPINFAQLAMA